MIAFFSAWGEPALPAEVDWEEVCLKARLRRRSPPKVVQGLDVVLYAAIVSVLERCHTLLTVPELCEELHLETLPLRPEDLPAGRIVAYAPGVRFLKHETTRYGLREWVEDEFHRRGRISKTRIVSPLGRFQAGLERDVVLKFAADSGMAQRHGLVFLPELLSSLRAGGAKVTLGTAQVEIFKKQVIAALRSEYVPIGGGFWAERRRWKVLRGIRNVTERRAEVTVRLGLSDLSETLPDLTAPNEKVGEDWPTLRQLVG
jgi:hypothetical protein